MDRRTFLFVFSLGALSAPLAAAAQPTGKVYRIGYLAAGSATVFQLPVEAFREGLRELGLVEGQNIVIDYRFAEGRFDRLPDLAAELVRLRVDVIMAGPTPSAVAAKNATRMIPIVMAGVGDPVELGLIASLARPGGNVRGLSFSVGMDIFGKGLELLREAVPKLRRVAILSTPAVAAVAAAPWAGRRPRLGGYVTRMGPTDGATAAGGHWSLKETRSNSQIPTPFPHRFPLKSHALTSVEGLLGQDEIDAAIQTTSTSKVRRVDFGGCGPAI